MATPDVRDAGPGNRLLLMTPAGCLDWLRSRLTSVSLVAGQVLYEPGEVIEHVFFPESGVVSTAADAWNSGQDIEIGRIGREGLVDVRAVLDDRPVAFHRTVVQIPGCARRISFANLCEGIALFPDFRHQCQRFVQAYVTQLEVIAVCNTTHSLVERCARWILLSRDLAARPDVPITQESLATLLGARRAGVTAAAGELQRAGFIRYSRGLVQILDRDGLEGMSCGCYRRIADELDRLLPAAASGHTNIGDGCEALSALGGAR